MTDSKVVEETLKAYSEKVKELYESGETTELSFRIVLHELLKNVIPSNYNVQIIEEAKREKFGSPDFKVKTNTKIIGYIETKDITVDIHKLKGRDKEQIDRYVKNVENLILTNYKDFILYQNGKKVLDIAILDEDFELIESSIERFYRLVQQFLSVSTPEIKSVKELAKFLAKRARILRDIVLENLDEDEDLKSLYLAFKEHLVSGMTKDEFADAYAQTVVYGLFMARFNVDDKLTREKVLLKGIPKSLSVVHGIFRYIVAFELPSYLEWIIDEIITILNNVNILRIKRDFKMDKEDPFLHFYEDFLAEYDPKLRKSKGVYYTPLPIVEFIINSVDVLLKEKFGKKLYDKDIRILDPAVGTGTFLAVLLRKIYNELKSSAVFKKCLEDRLLNNIYGFEILISPYLIAHLKLSLFLKMLGVDLNDLSLDEKEKRFKVYLTNALDVLREKSQGGLLERYLDEESEKADYVKQKENIFVVIGNPPYDVSPSVGWISELMNDYLYGLGVESEKKKGALQDDYVKFIRLAQWKIEQNGKGIVGFVTNNSYLDGLVHRRMRQSLMETFDEIYILNLHGNKRRGESDENVFDIQQGVCIGLFVKLKEGRHKAEDCKFYYYSIVNDVGLVKREEKDKFLKENNVKTIDWRELKPKEPYYFFVPKDLSLEEEYNSFPKLDEIFEVYSSGVETQKDNVAIGFTSEQIEKTIKDFLSLNEDVIRRKYKVKDSRDWKLSKVIRDLKEDFTKLGENWNMIREKRIKPLLYRPFDVRWTYFFDKSRSFVAYPRYEVMKHFVLGNNMCLIALRRTFVENSDILSSFILTSDLIVNRDIMLSGKGIFNTGKAQIFPLYRYEENKLTKEIEKVPNIKSEFLKFLKEKYNATPEDFLYYTYAVLHDPKYRKRYAEFLKIDFPRVPLYDKETFDKYKQIGKELVELHLMKKDISIDLAGKVKGENLRVEKVKYDAKLEGVRINNKTILFGIPEDVWNYKIGGYQVIEKYLKSRKGRELSLDELEHIYRVVEIIKRTIELVKVLEGINPKYHIKLIFHNIVN